MKSQPLNRIISFTVTSALFLTAVIQPVIAGSFSITGSMHHPRRGHTATLLPDGRVLVMGGYDETNYLTSAELYDPNTGMWTDTGDMASVHFTATLLPNGKVLAAGGFDSSAELYDPATGTWLNTGLMNFLYAPPTATLLANGKVLIAGGAFGGANELYNPTNGTWATNNPSVSDHWFHTATLLTNGQVLVVGGYDYSVGHNIHTSETFNPISGTWTATSDLPTGLDGSGYHTATLLPNGKMLVAGGFDYQNSIGGPLAYFSSAELYDPLASTWTLTCSMSTSRESHMATLLNNGMVLVVGGYNADSFNLTSAELYDPNTGTWTPTGSTHDPRNSSIATLLTNGTVLVAGGYGQNGDFASAELYDPAPAIARALFVSSGSTNSQVTRIAPDGMQSPFATFATDQIFGVAFDSAGNLFVSEDTTGLIVKITPTGSQSTFASGLNAPVALAFDASGNLFEADLGSGNIYKFTPAGAQSTFATGLSGPRGLAFDSSGNLFVSDGGMGTIFKFTSSGTQTTFATGAGNPRGLAFDSSGNLFVVDKGAFGSTNGSIFKFSPTGTKSTFATGLGQPIGLAFDTTGNLFVSEYFNGRILRFTPAGSESIYATGIDGPQWLAFETATGIILKNPTTLPCGAFQFSFTATAGANFSVLSATNLALLLTNWTLLGSVPEISPGQFQFTDLTATNYSQRFYRVRGIAVADTPPNMVLIPAGPFIMGDTLDGESDATPVTNVYVSAFYMEINLVSFSQWQSVYNWATNQGYGFVHAGAGKAGNHPVQTVDWYDAVKWSNARSQQAGLTPVYYTDAGLTLVYTNGETDAIYANWAVKGYRLPTEAEFEKAARDGLVGQRSPWGNTISESQANYYGSTSDYTYDLGPNGYNAIGSIGGIYPATSPVGSFAANGYGLYDMAGNVWERCWDWYGTPYAGGSDPHGPASSVDGDRAMRGGTWPSGADASRCAFRGQTYPSEVHNALGFRCVRKQ